MRLIIHHCHTVTVPPLLYCHTVIVPPAAGYIGQKGIGFKSVFRVTSAPEIHSNGFHISFNLGAQADGSSLGNLGYVVPTWVGPGELSCVVPYCTAVYRIVLYLYWHSIHT